MAKIIGVHTLVGPQIQTIQLLTSGTFVDFVIPAGVKRVTIMFNAISTNGTSLQQVQLASNGSVETTGYTSGSGSRTGESAITSGFLLAQVNAAASLYSGSMVLNLVDAATRRWNSSNIYNRDDGFAGSGGGFKALAGNLDRVRLTTINGTDQFDGGSLNVSYEY